MFSFGRLCSEPASDVSGALTGPDRTSQMMWCIRSRATPTFWASRSAQATREYRCEHTGSISASPAFVINSDHSCLSSHAPGLQSILVLPKQSLAGELGSPRHQSSKSVYAPRYSISLLRVSPMQRGPWLQLQLTAVRWASQLRAEYSSHCTSKKAATRDRAMPMRASGAGAGTMTRRTRGGTAAAARASSP